MKAIATVLALTLAMPAIAGDMAAAISHYRRAHGLSAVKTDQELTKIAQRQANAMASSNLLDHGVGGNFASRLSGANASSAAENIAVGTKTWDETFRLWKSSAGHNANLLRGGATRVGVAVAFSTQPPHRPFWAMVIANRDPASAIRRARPLGQSRKY